MNYLMIYKRKQINLLFVIYDIYETVLYIHLNVIENYSVVNDNNSNKLL